MPPRVSERERLAVKETWARMDAARNVWKNHAANFSLYEDALRNVFPLVMPGMDDASAARDQVNVNLTARVVAFLKSKLDNSPEIRVSGMREEDMETAAFNEHLLSRITESGGLPSATRDAIDNMMTGGSAILWFGVDAYAIDHRRLAGLATDPGELVASAAQGQVVHPLPGMDLLQVAETARNVYVESTWTRTEMQKENLLRLAAEAEQMFHDEKEKAQTFTPYKFWYQALKYGYGLLGDSTVFRREDMSRMWRRIVFSPEQFKAWEPFKASVRNQAQPTTITPESGRETIPLWSFDFDKASAPVIDINKCHVVWEEWNRITTEVHYTLENWPGWLEEDSTYPYLGGDGRPVWDDFFPCEWAVPYKHNIPDATQPLGVPAIAYFFPQQLELIRYRSAALASAARAANIYLISSRLDSDQKEDLRQAKDQTLIEVPEDMMDKARPIVERLPMDAVPQAFYTAGMQAESDLYATASVARSAITSDPSSDTVGQEELITRGAGAIQGDILSLVANAYSRMVRKTADAVRILCTPQHVARYVGSRYITPVVDQKTGQVVEPAPFDKWRADSLDGVDIVASFATKGAGEDPILIKMLTDLLVATMNLKDASGLPMKDPKPIFDLLTKRMGVGLVPDYKPSKTELLIAALSQAIQKQGQGGQPGQPQMGPGGGDQSGRRKDMGGGDRGAPMIPGRQGRHRTPPDAGDRSNVAMRMGAGA